MAINMITAVVALPLTYYFGRKTLLAVTLMFAAIFQALEQSSV